MSELLKNIIKGSVIYGISEVGMRAISIILMPLFTRYLSPSEYGELEYIITVVMFLELVIDMGLTSAFWKYYSDKEYSKGNVLFNLIVSQVILGGGVIAASISCLWLGLSSSDLYYFIVVLLCAEVIALFLKDIKLVLRAEEKQWFYMGVSFFQVGVFFIANLVFLVGLKFSYEGVIYSYLCAYSATCICFGFLLKGRLDGSVSKSTAYGMLFYGLPIMLGNIAGSIVSISDKLLLKNLACNYDLGIYGFSYKIGSIIKLLLITPFFLAWNPIRWKIYQLPESKAIFTSIYKPLFLILCCCGLCIVSLFPLFFHILAGRKEYLEGLSVSFMVGTALIFYGLYYYNAMGLLFTGKTNYILMIVSAGGLINLGLNLVLIPSLSINGAAIATFVSYFSMYLLSVYYSQRFYPIDRDLSFEVINCFLLILLSGCMVFFSVRFENVITISGASFLCACVFLISNALKEHISVRHAVNALKQFYKQQ